MNYINYTKICIMCPTYGRAEKQLPAFIRSLLACTDDYGSICLCFIVNKEDIESVITINKLCGAEVEFEIIYEETKECNLSHYFNLAYNKTTFNSPGTCVSMFGDDMVFVTQGWEEMVLEKINDLFGYGLVYGDDDYCQHEKLCVYFVTTRELVEITGKPFMCESFAIDFIDEIWMKFTNKMHCAAYLPNLHIRHEHASKVSPDKVWIRMRKQFGNAYSNSIHIDSYVDEMVDHAKQQLTAIGNSDITFVMNTYNRINLLEQTVNSWNQSFVLPEKIHVFDDCSDDPNHVGKIINNMINANYTPSKEHLRCDKRNIVTLSLFDSPAIMVIDSDTVFAPHWLLAVIDAWERIKNKSEIAGVTLFNTINHKVIDGNELLGDLMFKQTIGGFGALYKKETIRNVFYKNNILDLSIPWGWDCTINQYVQTNKLKYCCSGKSYLQHIGINEGTHVSDADKSDYALDFVGEYKMIFMHKNKTANFTPPQNSNILFAAMARLGDVIAASMIVNMLAEKGYNITWIVIPIYKKLAENICPGVKIITMEPLIDGPQGDWSETTTSQMKNNYPNYAAYINAQIGSRENHQDYTTSGKHPCLWIRDLCNNVLNINLNDNFNKYLRYNNNRISLNNYKNIPDNLGIICKESKTVPAFPDIMFENISNELKAAKYSVRYLTKKRPQHHSTRNVRENYLFGMSIEECILMIKKAKLFVGQDSGMSWCSLFSDCHKKIYHRKSRIKMVNTFFNKIDSKAEDIIVED
jgi:ADP-heptose:LPS heptosyltransferase